MIAKISKGSSFRGCLSYVLEKSGGEKIGGNMIGDTVRELSSEFGHVRQMKEGVGKPVYHVSLALPEGEHFSDTEWEKIANKYLARMGLDPLQHQHIIVRHTDTGHDHVHIVASRIALDGTVFDAFRDQIKSKTICRQLEAEHGLVSVPNEKKQHRAKTTQKERRMNQRTGRDSEKIHVQQVLSSLLTDGATFTPQSLSVALETKGVVLIPNIASTGKMNGFSFQYAGRSYTGAQVGYAWKYLQPHLSIGADDVQWMQARRQQLQEGTPSDAIRSIRNAVWETGILNVPFERRSKNRGGVRTELK